MMSKNLETQGFLEQPRRKAEMMTLIKDLLVSMKYTETVKAIDVQTECAVDNEPFEEKLSRLEAATYRSDVQKRSTISKVLEQEYVNRIEKEKIHEALDLLSNKMQKYCSNLQKLSTYLLSLPKRQPKLLNILSPYFLKEKCPPLPKYKCMKAVFQTDQVWIVKSRGKYIMSTDKQSNGKMFVEDLNDGWKLQAQKRSLHKQIILCVNWMKDNVVGTTSEDNTAKLWSAGDLDCLHTINLHYATVSSIVFTSEHIITGGFDKIVVMDNSFVKKQEIASRKVYQMIVTKDGKLLFTLTCGKHQVNIISMQTLQEVGNIKQKHTISTMALSKNQKYLFLNTSYTKPQIHVWSVDKQELIQKWTGHQQKKFVLRMDNGGPYGQFTAVGSENGQVLIFHISHATPIHRFKACRNKPVNCVSWLDENRLVECNDDRSVQVWTAKDNGGELKLIQQPAELHRREPTRQQIIRLMMMPHTVFQNNDDSDLSI